MDSNKRPVNLEGEEIGKDEGTLARMFRKFKSEPAVPIGMLGWTGLVGYGLYKVKNRKTELGIYLIDLRVKAQAFAVGCMTLAVIYNIYKVTAKNKPKSTLGDNNAMLSIEK